MNLSAINSEERLIAQKFRRILVPLIGRYMGKIFLGSACDILGTTSPS